MPSQQISAEEIYARIPHSGAMRLLDAVLSWDKQSILCSATSHLDSDNPLREDGLLSSVHALEYAAQAMAVHGSLSAEQGSGDAAVKQVYVATFRNIGLMSEALDRTADTALDIQARQDGAVAGGWSYEFSVAARGTLIASGTATVVATFGPAGVSQ
jgi:predicted hotdog family 3-hydroxylacyl-ACP dehydratase